jgi:hypothetical protein
MIAEQARKVFYIREGDGRRGVKVDVSRLFRCLVSDLQWFGVRNGLSVSRAANTMGELCSQIRFARPLPWDSHDVSSMGNSMYITFYGAYAASYTVSSIHDLLKVNLLAKRCRDRRRNGRETSASILVPNHKVIMPWK